MSKNFWKGIAWGCAIGVLMWGIAFSVWATEPHSKPSDATQTVNQSQAQDQSQRQSQGQTSNLEAAQGNQQTNLSLLLSTPMSTADCVAVYGVIVANIPYRNKDCVKVSLYHVLMAEGHTQSAQFVICSTKVLRQVFGSADMCMLSLHADVDRVCAERQERLEQFALSECEK